MAKKEIQTNNHSIFFFQKLDSRGNYNKLANFEEISLKKTCKTVDERDNCCILKPICSMITNLALWPFRRSRSKVTSKALQKQVYI